MQSPVDATGEEVDDLLGDEIDGEPDVLIEENESNEGDVLITDDIKVNMPKDGRHESKHKN